VTTEVGLWFEEPWAVDRYCKIDRDEATVRLRKLLPKRA
jgi:hypothetical protein